MTRTASLQHYRQSAPYHKVWTDIINGATSICVSNDILEEYEEILSRKTTPEIAEAVIAAILEAPKTRKVEPTFFYNLIVADPDDNKFVDARYAGMQNSLSPMMPISMS